MKSKLWEYPPQKKKFSELSSFNLQYTAIVLIQNHRRGEAGREPWRSSGPIPAQAGTPTAGLPGPGPVGFWVPPRGRHHSLSVYCSSAQSPIQHRCVSLCLDITSCIPVCARYLLPWHQAPLQRAWLHPLQVVTDTDKNPRASSSLDWTVPDLPASPRRRGAPGSWPPWWPWELGSFQYGCLSIVLGTQNWAPCSRCSLTKPSSGERSPPDLLRYFA